MPTWRSYVPAAAEAFHEKTGARPTSVAAAAGAPSSGAAGALQPPGVEKERTSERAEETGVQYGSPFASTAQ